MLNFFIISFFILFAVAFVLLIISIFKNFSPFDALLNSIKSPSYQKLIKELSKYNFSKNTGDKDENIVCPHCGTENKVGSVFCNFCGKTLL